MKPNHSRSFLPDFMEFNRLIDDHHKNKGEQTQEPGGHGNVIHFVSHWRLKVYPEIQVQDSLDNLAQQPAVKKRTPQSLKGKFLNFPPLLCTLLQSKCSQLIHQPRK